MEQIKLLKNNNKLEEMNEIEMEMTLSPLVRETVSTLNSYGITDEEIVEDFGNLNNEGLALMGLVLNELEEAAKLPTDVSAFRLNSILDCTVEALGISDIVGVFDAFTAGGAGRAFADGAIKYGLRQVGKNIATRLIGPAAVVVTTVQFGYCMYQKNTSCEILYSPSPSPGEVRYDSLVALIPKKETSKSESKKNYYTIDNDYNNGIYLFLYEMVGDKPADYIYKSDDIVNIRYVKQVKASDYHKVPLLLLAP